MEPIESPDVVKSEIDTTTGIKVEAEGVKEPVGFLNVAKKFVKSEIVAETDIKLEAEVTEPFPTFQTVQSEGDTKVNIKLEAEDVVEPVETRIVTKEFVESKIKFEPDVAEPFEFPNVSPFVKSEVAIKAEIKREPEDIVDFPIIAKELIKLEVDASTQLVAVYNCGECNFQAATNKELKKHTRIIHEKGCYICKICGYDKAMFADELRRHKLLHLNETLFECDQCGYETTVESRLTNHMKNHELQKWETFECGFCKFICPKFGKLERHMRGHGDHIRFYRCKECSYTSQRQRHVIVHTQEECFKCEACDYQTSCKRDLEKHSVIHAEADEKFLASNSSAPSNIQRKIPEAKVYNCDLCPVQTETNKELKMHKYLQHKKRNKKKKGYCCEVCGLKLMFSARQLQNHKLTHLNEPLLKCNWCDYVSTTAFRLKQHINNIHIFKKPHGLQHTDTSSASSDSQATRAANLNFTVCANQAFTSKQPETQCINPPKRRRKRKLTCNGYKKKKTEASKVEEGFKCKICDYQTSCEDTLGKHTMLHAGYKPYKCTECEYSTVWKHCLEEHVVTHVSFACNECDYKTNLENQLQIHLDLHRNLRETFQGKVEEKKEASQCDVMEID